MTKENIEGISPELEKYSSNLFVITGLSGSGKSTLVQSFLSNHQEKNFAFLKTYTTRIIRPSEVYNPYSEYEFVNHERYLEKRNSSNIWDHNEFYGNFYGVNLDDLFKYGNYFLIAYPDLNILSKIKKFYPAKITIILIKTPFEICSERIIKERPDSHTRIVTEKNINLDKIQQICNYIFVPSNDLNVDIQTFEEIIFGIQKTLN